MCFNRSILCRDWQQIYSRWRMKLLLVVSSSRLKLNSWRINLILFSIQATTLLLLLKNSMLLQYISQFSSRYFLMPMSSWLSLMILMLLMYLQMMYSYISLIFSRRFRKYSLLLYFIISTLRLQISSSQIKENPYSRFSSRFSSFRLGRQISHLLRLQSRLLFRQSLSKQGRKSLFSLFRQLWERLSSFRYRQIMVSPNSSSRLPDKFSFLSRISCSRFWMERSWFLARFSSYKLNNFSLGSQLSLLLFSARTLRYLVRLRSKSSMKLCPAQTIYKDLQLSPSTRMRLCSTLSSLSQVRSEMEPISLILLQERFSWMSLLQLCSGCMSEMALNCSSASSIFTNFSMPLRLVIASKVSLIYLKAPAFQSEATWDSSFSFLAPSAFSPLSNSQLTFFSLAYRYFKNLGLQSLLICSISLMNLLIYPMQSKKILYRVYELPSFFPSYSHSGISSKDSTFDVIFLETTLISVVEIAFRGFRLFCLSCLSAISGAFLGSTVDSLTSCGLKLVKVLRSLVEGICILASLRSIFLSLGLTNLSANRLERYSISYFMESLSSFSMLSCSLSRLAISIFLRMASSSFLLCRSTSFFFRKLLFCVRVDWSGGAGWRTDMLYCSSARTRALWLEFSATLSLICWMRAGSMTFLALLLVICLRSQTSFSYSVIISYQIYLFFFSSSRIDSSFFAMRMLLISPIRRFIYFSQKLSSSSLSDSIAIASMSRKNRSCSSLLNLDMIIFKTLYTPKQLSSSLSCLRGAK